MNTTKRIPQNQFEQLLEINKNPGWITSDLKVVPSSALGRLFWIVARHFECLQKLFYGLNLRETKEALNAIRVNIQKINPTYKSYDRVFNLFNKAVQRFNELAPKKLQMEFISTRVSVLTYNILFPQLEGKQNEKYSSAIGYNENSAGDVYENSHERLPIIIKNIQDANIDINCLQEVTEKTFKTLQNNLSSNYTGVFAAHNPTSKKPQEHGVAIFYKTKKFELLNHSSIAFSKQKIDQNGILSTHPNGKPILHKRTHFVMDLRETLTKKVIRAVSCHFIDPREFVAKEKQDHVNAVINSALQYNPQVKPDQIVIAGDFNQDQWGDVSNGNTKNNNPQPNLQNATALQPLFGKGFDSDDNLDSTEFKREDSKDFNSEIISKDRKIDHIFVKYTGNGSSLKPVNIILEKFSLEGSDHKAVAALI